jgi:hypothetical protein
MCFRAFDAACVTAELCALMLKPPRMATGPHGATAYACALKPRCHALQHACRCVWLQAARQRFSWVPRMQTAWLLRMQPCIHARATHADCMAAAGRCCRQDPGRGAQDVQPLVGLVQPVRRGTLTCTAACVPVQQACQKRWCAEWPAGMLTVLSVQEAQRAAGACGRAQRASHTAADIL